MSNTYFFSTEGYSPQLPVRCREIRRLKSANNREAFLYKCEHAVDRYGTDYLVFVPKHQGKTLANVDAQPLYVYVIDGRPYKNKKTIDLSPGHKMVWDWGGISTSLDTAAQLQVSAEDVRASNDVLSKQGFDDQPG